MKKTLLTLVLIGSLLACVGFCDSPREVGENYPRTFIVTELIPETNTVVCVDAVGMEWEFQMIDDWQIGDIVSAIMRDNGTKNITDDSFVSVRYAGWNFPIDMFLD